LNRDGTKGKKRKIRWLLSSALFILLISPWLGYLLTQFLNAAASGSINHTILDVNYFHALCSQKNGSTATFSVVTGVLMFCVVALITTDRTSKLSSVGMMKVTDDISIPVSAGNGQHGSERFLTEKEKRDLYAVYTPGEKFTGKAGLVINYEKIGRKERFYYIKDDLHSMVIGTTGAGKDRRVMLTTLFLQIMSGVSIALSDVKGDMYCYTSDFARKNGYDVAVLDLRQPEKSDRYNFLQPILNALAEGNTPKAIDATWDLVSVLVGQQKGEPLWYNGETATIAAAILCVCLEAPPEYRNMANVYYFIAYMCKSDMYGQMPLNEYLNNLADDHPAKGVFAMAQIAASKTRSSFFTSALGTLRLFTNPNIAAMTSVSDFDLKDIGRKKNILYMIVPDDKKTLYPLVSIMVTQLYSQQIELANEHGQRLPVDTDYDLNELGNFPTIPCLGNILSAGRSRGIRVNAVIQDIQQMEKNYKEDFKNIKTNCQVKLYLKSDDPDTLKMVSESLGNYTVKSVGASNSVSTDRTNGGNFSNSSNLGGRKLLEPAEVGRINSPYAICMMTGRYGAVNRLPDISETFVNKEFGMGSRQENIELIRKFEKSRAIRELPKTIPLWGIWNTIKAEPDDGTQIKKKRVSFLKGDEE
jgi:TRAG family protein